MKKLFLLLIVSVFIFSACSENYSNGERIGLITQFSKTGLIWKSYEGHLNLTQTGMNSSVPFDFSIDNDNEPAGLVAILDSAAQHGWKVKIVYHLVKGWNLFNNRGHENYFVTKCEILDKNIMQTNFGIKPSTTEETSGKVIDTIYVMIVDKSKLK